MNLEQIKAYLLPKAEDDPGFRKEVVRQSHRGLAILGAVNIGCALFLTAARFVIAPDPATFPLRLAECAAVILIGIFLLLLSGNPRVAPYARNVGLATGFITSIILMWFSLSMCDRTAHADDFIPGQVTLVLLVGIAVFPLRPFQTFGIGAAMMAGYTVSARVAEAMSIPGAFFQATYLVFMMTLTLLATALTAVVFAERSQNYSRYKQKLQAEKDLQESQRRTMLAENAASLGRLAAALSHELNSPIGALSSAVDTLLLLSARQSTSPMDNTRFVLLLNDLRKTIGDSAGRLSDIVSRMQRISNLDGSEVQRVDVNDLLKDTLQMLESRIKEKANLDLDLREVPPLICKPVQLSAVFRNLINNSLDAVNGNGRIRVASRAVDGGIEIDIADNGHGMTKDVLENIFDPNFRVANGRVGTGNWSMFSSRQVIREHGGEIGIESSPGQGTQVKLSLPVQQFDAHS